jgi:hypothetical protein
MTTPKTPKASRTPNVALTSALSRARDTVAQIETALGDQTRVLSPADKKRSLRLRKGAEQVMQHIVELVQQYKLDSEGLHSEELLAQMERLAALRPLETQLTQIATRVSNERFLVGSDAWSMALAFYAMLQRRALDDANLTEALGPIGDFFSTGRAAGKPTKLQTRANRKLAQAQRLVQHANARATTTTAPAASPPVQPQAPSPSAAAPQLQPPSAAKPNGALNGASNGALNGASNGALNGSATS